MQDKENINLSMIYFNASQRCNLFCKHCWQSSPVVKDKEEYARKVSDEITLDELKPAIEEALELGLEYIKITGGEPFLRPNMLDFIQYFSQKGLSVSIETNGTLINEETAKSLKGLNIAHVSVSIDSSLSDEHDTFRGVSGAFQKTITAIEFLVKHNIPTQIIFSIYRKNLPRLWETISLATKLGVQSFKINHICSIGRGSDLEQSGQTLSVKEALDLESEIERTSFNGRKLPVFLDIPLAFRSVRSIEQGLKTGSTSHCDVVHLLGILADGGISFCGIGSQEKTLVVGNIRRESLKKIWLESAILKRLRREVPYHFEGICKQCIMKGFCLGGCRAEVYSTRKSFVKSYAFCEEAYNAGLFPKSRMTG